MVGISVGHDVLQGYGQPSQDVFQGYGQPPSKKMSFDYEYLAIGILILRQRAADTERKKTSKNGNPSLIKEV